MPTIPREPFTLTGGCYCQAIRYTISVPELSARPIHHPEDGSSIGKLNDTTERLPRVEIDHCSMCRRIQGSVVLVWIMVLRSWVQFSLLQKDAASTLTVNNQDRVSPETMDVLNGVPEIATKTFVSKFSSSKDVDRIFCSRCGTHLTFRYNKPEDTPESKQSVDLTFGSLDPEFLEWECFKPVEDAYVDSGIGWVVRWVKEGEKALLEG